jgi:hypothetical protein
MEERHLRIVGPEGDEPFATAIDPSDAVSLVDGTQEQDPSFTDADVVIRVEEATDEPEPPDDAIRDPNTGERIVHPSLQGRDLRPPATVRRPVTRGDGRLREYLRLVEGP